VLHSRRHDEQHLLLGDIARAGARKRDGYQQKEDSKYITYLLFGCASCRRSTRTSNSGPPDEIAGPTTLRAWAMTVDANSGSSFLLEMSSCPVPSCGSALGRLAGRTGVSAISNRKCATDEGGALGRLIVSACSQAKSERVVRGTRCTVLGRRAWVSSRRSSVARPASGGQPTPPSRLGARSALIRSTRSWSTGAVSCSSQQGGWSFRGRPTSASCGTSAAPSTCGFSASVCWPTQETTISLSSANTMCEDILAALEFGARAVGHRVVPLTAA
jgi:hypothetical protein